MDGAVGLLFPALCSAVLRTLLGDIPRELGISPPTPPPPTHGRVIYTREICKHYKPDLFLPGNQTLNRCQCATAFEVQRRWGRRDRSKENLRTDADPIAHWESVCLLCSL